VGEELVSIQKTDLTFIKLSYQKGLCIRTLHCRDFIKVCL